MEMNKGLLELFEGIKKEFAGLSLDDFTTKVHNENHKLEFWSAVSGTPIQDTWTPIQDAKNKAANTNYPLILREEAYQEFQYKVDEVIARLKSGTVSISKKRISEEIVNQVSDPKIKRICIEINNTNDANILSLTQSLGECLKWSLWYQAKKVGTKLKEGGELKPLLDEAIKTPYYTDNAANRFLKEFRDNFLKTGYDMVRHSDNYIPDIVVVNPAIDALEHILRITFSTKP